MKRIFVFVTVIVLSLVASGVLLAQDNPFVGNWTLNLAKSKFTGAQAPKSETRTIVAQGNGETVTYGGIAADGSSIAYSLTTNFDGKDSPYSGTQPFGADTVAVKRMDANTTTSISKKAGKTLFRTRTVVSKDGKVSTQTTRGTNAQGQPISVRTVWDKQ
jgi:hypothetical protein